MSPCCAPQLGHLCGCSSARSVSLHYSIHCISPEYKTYLPVALHPWQDPALCQASVISTCSSACHSVLALSTGGSWLIDFLVYKFSKVVKSSVLVLSQTYKYRNYSYFRLSMFRFAKESILAFDQFCKCRNYCYCIFILKYFASCSDSQVQDYIYS